jgi:hypothetical protein
MRKASLGQMRSSVGVLILLTSLAGCAPKAEPPRPQMNPGNMQAPTLTIEQVGQNSFGTAYRSARKDGETAEFVYSAPADGTAQERFRRVVMMSSTAIPTTLRTAPETKRIRFVIVDPKDTARKLVVFSLTKEQARSIGGHGSPEALLGIVKIESAEPEFKAAAAQPKA